jgi:hypothetical protein
MESGMNLETGKTSENTFNSQLRGISLTSMKMKSMKKEGRMQTVLKRIA